MCTLATVMFYINTVFNTLSLIFKVAYLITLNRSFISVLFFFFPLKTSPVQKVPEKGTHSGHRTDLSGGTSVVKPECDPARTTEYGH